MNQTRERGKKRRTKENVPCTWRNFLLGTALRNGTPHPPQHLPAASLLVQSPQFLRVPQPHLDNPTPLNSSPAPSSLAPAPPRAFPRTGPGGAPRAPLHCSWRKEGGGAFCSRRRTGVGGGRKLRGDLPSATAAAATAAAAPPPPVSSGGQPDCRLPGASGSGRAQPWALPEPPPPPPPPSRPVQSLSPLRARAAPAPRGWRSGGWGCCLGGRRGRGQRGESQWFPW